MKVVPLLYPFTKALILCKTCGYMYMCNQHNTVKAIILSTNRYTSVVISFLLFPWKVDLKCISPSSGGLYYPEHLEALGKCTITLSVWFMGWI